MLATVPPTPRAIAAEEPFRRALVKNNTRGAGPAVCGAVVLPWAPCAPVLSGCYHHKAPEVCLASARSQGSDVVNVDQAKVKSAPSEPSRTAPAPPTVATPAGARPLWAWIALAGLPILGAALRVALFGIESPSYAEGQNIEVAIAEAAATAGCFVAATSFEWRDHLARAWALQGCMYLLLLTRCLGLAFGILSGSPSAILADGVLTSVANVGGIFATWMLARTGQLAGIDIVISPHLRRLAWLVAAVIACAAAGPGIIRGIGRLAAGNPAAVVSIASRTGDIFSFVFIAPLLLTTLALRQGLLVWPWALLTASGLCWLSADFSNTALSHLPGHVGPLYDVFRVPACLFVLTAGIAQRWVIDARELDSPAAKRA